MLRRIKRTMQIGQLVAGIAGLTFGLLIDFFSDWLEDQGSMYKPIVLIVFVVALLITIWLWSRRQDRIGLDIGMVKTLRSQQEKEHHARRGLIAFVSLYTPPKGSEAAALSPDERHKRAQNGEYAFLDLPKSNLAPVIDAITTHASRLEHCWLVGTTSRESKRAGSCVYIPALSRYLEEIRHVGCQFHFEEYCIPLDDDALVFDKTVELIQRIFREVDSLEIEPGDVIADFTSGFRSLTLGMILASLDRDRDIQLIGTHYDANGRWTDERFPIIFRFEPVLRSK